MRLDRETEGLIKLAMRDRRAIEAGHMKPEDSLYLPPGTKVKDGKVTLPPTGAGAATVIVAGAAGSIVAGYGVLTLSGLALTLLFSAAREAFIYEVRGLPLYLYLAFVVGCLFLGTIFAIGREIRQWLPVAVAQVIIAVAAGMFSFLTTSDPIGKWIVFFAAAIAVADGLTVVLKITRLSAKDSQHPSQL